MKDKRFHLAIHITEEQKWKLKEVAAKRKQTMEEMSKEKLLELIKEENGNNNLH